MRRHDRAGSWTRRTYSRVRGGFRAAALILVAAGGCSEFSTRTPEDPSSVEAPSRQRVHPDSVLWNIEMAWEFKVPSAHVANLDEDFLFVADPFDIASFDDPELFTDWGRAQEQSAIGDVLDIARRDDLACAYAWGATGELRDFTEGEVSGRWYEDVTYNVTFTEPGRTVRFSGQADLYFVESNALWLLYKWSDQVDGSANRSTGYLRGRRSFD